MVPCSTLVGMESRVGSSKIGASETPSSASSVTGTPASSAIVGYRSTSSVMTPATWPTDFFNQGARTIRGTRTPSSKFVYCSNNNRIQEPSQYGGDHTYANQKDLINTASESACSTLCQELCSPRCQPNRHSTQQQIEQTRTYTEQDISHALNYHHNHHHHYYLSARTLQCPCVYVP